MLNQVQSHCVWSGPKLTWIPSKLDSLYESAYLHPKHIPLLEKSSFQTCMASSSRIKAQSLQGRFPSIVKGTSSRNPVGYPLQWGCKSSLYFLGLKDRLQFLYQIFCRNWWLFEYGENFQCNCVESLGVSKVMWVGKFFQRDPRTGNGSLENAKRNQTLWPLVCWLLMSSCCFSMGQWKLCLIGYSSSIPSSYY